MELKYGDVLVARERWLKRAVVNPKHCFRFRIDPVPFVLSSSNWYSKYLRHPKTTQERKLTLAYKGFIRGRRSLKYLPDYWDEVPRADRDNKRSWKKNKIKRQWMKHTQK